MVWGGDEERVDAEGGRERWPHQVHPRNGHKTYHMLMRWRTPWHAPHSNSSLYTARIADSSSLFIIAIARWWHTIPLRSVFLASLEEITKRRIKWKCRSVITWYRFISRFVCHRMLDELKALREIYVFFDYKWKTKIAFEFSFHHSFHLLEIAVKNRVKSVLGKIRFQRGRNRAIVLSNDIRRLYNMLRNMVKDFKIWRMK